MLFAASSGILGLAAKRQALEAEADTIFAARRSVQRTFYQLLDRHEAARADERNSELRATEWKRRNDDIARLEDEHTAKTQERLALRLRQAEIENLLRLQPILAEMDEEARQLSGYADIETLFDDVGARLTSALEAGREAETVLRQAQAAVEKIGRDIERLELHPALVLHHSAIADLVEERGAVRTYKTNLPRVMAERDQFSSSLEEYAVRLGLARPDFDRLRPGDPQIAHAEECLTRLREAEARIDDIDRRIGEDAANLARLQEERPHGTLIDPDLWRRQIAALKPDIDRLSILETARADLAGKRRRIAERAASLEPSITDLDKTAQAPHAFGRYLFP